MAISIEQFGIPIPQVFLESGADMTLVRETLALADRLGYHSAWVQDQVAGDVPLLEAISLLCYASAVTERIRLGVSVLVFPIRNAAQLAKSVATLDHMSDGRVILGIGLGPVFAGDRYFKVFGTRADEALRRFNEGLAVMQSLWTEPSVTFGGEFYQLDGTAMEPKPVQRPHPPVWFGGQHPDAIARAAIKANGYMGAGPTTTAHFADHVRLLRQALERHDRDPMAVPISKRVYLALDDDEARAKAGLDRFFAARYPWMIDSNPEFVSDICVWGSADRVAEGLAEVFSAGAGHIVLNPLWDFCAQIEGLATDVIPRIDGAL